MREIKFRAWDKLTKEIVNVKRLDLFNGKVGLGWNEYDGVTWRDIKDLELMQYTGLKDKNGREIYEGDIVKGAGKNPTIYIVKWLDSYGGFAFIDKEKAIPAFEFLINFCEVIGNIYENPELLKGVNK